MQMQSQSRQVTAGLMYQDYGDKHSCECSYNDILSRQLHADVPHTLSSLIVLQYTTQRTLCCRQRAIQHVNIVLLGFACWRLGGSQSNFKSSRLHEGVEPVTIVFLPVALTYVISQLTEAPARSFCVGNLRICMSSSMHDLEYSLSLWR